MHLPFIPRYVPTPEQRARGYREVRSHEGTPTYEQLCTAMRRAHYLPAGEAATDPTLPQDAFTRSLLVAAARVVEATYAPPETKR